MEPAKTLEWVITPLQKKKQQVCINLPSSKSMLNRSLLMYALQFRRLPAMDIAPEAEDVAMMYDVLMKIVNSTQEQQPVTLYCGNAGTVVRMASVVAAFFGGQFVIQGDEKMLMRPMAELIQLLEQLGVEVECPCHQGFLPIVIRSQGFRSKHSILSVSANQSSQHLSGLLLTAPFIPGGLTIERTSDTVSWPYVELTIKMMQAAGALVSIDGNRITVHEGSYQNVTLETEADWSSAAFFFQALTLLPVGSEILLSGLAFTGNQGDEVVANLFARLGIETTSTPSGIRIQRCHGHNALVQVDFKHCPDLFNSFAMGVAASGVKGELTGLAHLPFKESDRLANLCSALKENGFPFHVSENVLTIHPRTSEMPETLRFASHGDHRVAMSAAMWGVKYPAIVKDPLVVAKSFPQFYTQLQKLTVIS
jgi:3-phosphoshikimate 1-carboxyvinyltransferase